MISTVNTLFINTTYGRFPGKSLSLRDVYYSSMKIYDPQIIILKDYKTTTPKDEHGYRCVRKIIESGTVLKFDPVSKHFMRVPNHFNFKNSKHEKIKVEFSSIPQNIIEKIGETYDR